MGHVSKSFVMMGIIDPRDYGAVLNNGSDCTAAVTAAMTEATPGQVVFFAPGNWTFAGNLVIPPGISLVGTSRCKTPGVLPKLIPDPRTWGSTVFSITGGSGVSSVTATPFILMGYGTTVDGISFYYPNQGLPDDSSVVAYPYTIGTYSDGPDWPHVSYNVVIQNCTFINPYQAVRMTGGFPFNIDNCFFSPAINAVYVDVMKDTSFITRCHVEPVWFGSRSTGDISAASMAYALANLIAYQVFRADSLCISDSMCFVAKTGLSLQASATPESGLSSAWFLGNNMAFDICDIGIDAQSVAQQGAVINNVTITTAPTSANNIGIRVAHSATGPGTLSVANSSICSQSGREIVVTGGRSRFTGCTFYSYGGAASGSSPSVAVTGGDVTVMGCDFADARPQMSFTGGGKAIFSNNTCGSNGVSVTGVTSSNSL